MRGTLVNNDNMNMFLPALGKDSIGPGDLIVGVVDDETDTACGVLWAMEEQKDNLSIREVIINKSYLDKGAGDELIAFFLDIAQEISIKNISFSYLKSEDTEYLYELFEKAGFADLSQELSEYAVRIGDFYISDRKIDDHGMKVVSVAELSDKTKSKLTMIDFDKCLENISFIAIDNKRLAGRIIFEQFRDMIRLRAYEAEGKEPRRILYLLIQKAFERIRTLYGPEMWMLLSVETDAILDELIRYTDGSVVRYSENVYFNLKL